MLTPNMFLTFFQYDFILRGLIAGIIIAMIAPIVGIFLVLRRYSLIADTLSHVSLAGIAIGFLLHISPLLSAIAATAISSTLIEKLRLSKRIYGESALALFLSGSLALAVVLISLSHGFNATLFNYLFGSIVTVTTQDVQTIAILGLVVAVVIGCLYKQLLYISFDEDSARVSGLPVSLLNAIFIILAAITISLAIPTVGVLLISALLIIPVITSLQFKKTFLPTLLIAEFFSVLAVLVGMLTSFYFNIAPGGTIVLTSLVFFFAVEFVT